MTDIPPKVFPLENFVEKTTSDKWYQITPRKTQNNSTKHSFTQVFQTDRAYATKAKITKYTSDA